MNNDLLSQDIQYLKGVGPVRAALLQKELNIYTLGDLLYTFPYKYIDRSTIHPICEIQESMAFVQLKGKILDFETEGEGRKRRLKAVFTDGTGYVELVWFNSIKHIEKNYKVNQEYVLLGKPTLWNGRISFAHPELEDAQKAMAGMEVMRPHYHLTDKIKQKGISSNVINELVKNAFALCKEQITDYLPLSIRQEYNLIDSKVALHSIHHPTSLECLPESSRRLKFEELFFLQLDILRSSQGRKTNRGFTFPRIGSLFHSFYNNCLPFKLTGAQQKVIKEIRQDMCKGIQMNRLLQGDVGSGKTLVALMCCIIAIDNGYQACIMAPTEILAEQHVKTIRTFLKDLPISVELLTSSVTGQQRSEILSQTANGQLQLLVGTHALIEPTVRFHNLGLAIIDEQHRFGVKQRAQLWEKNTIPPHVLVMTATPIPRTLAMTAYGDLDVSVIDELPPGRKPIKTLHYYEDHQGKLYDGIRNQLDEGRQIYIVYPLIEESEKSDLKNLETGYKLIKDVFPNYTVDMIHGRMKPAEKEETMQRFSSGQSQILVSTTVIEVGVNVPNASVMVVEEAQRFGLAQLHQLRGRVGRGADQSYCILVTGRALSETTRKRMQIMTETTDGFKIAEEDMRLRGPGDIEGTAQSGIPFDLKIANLVKDVELMAVAREAAARFLEQDPNQNLPQNATTWQRLRAIKSQQTDFSQIS